MIMQPFLKLAIFANLQRGQLCLYLLIFLDVFIPGLSCHGFQFAKVLAERKEIAEQDDVKSR